MSKDDASPNIQNKKLYKAFEGGAIYTATRGDSCVVIIDESSKSGELDDEGIQLITVISFNSKSESW